MIPGSGGIGLWPAAGGVTIDNSGVFNDGDTEYLDWKPTVAASSSRLKTISVWVKRGDVNQTSKDQYIFAAENNEDSLWIDTSHRLGYAFGGFVITGRTTEVFRDPHAWYHIVMRVDTTQASQADRVRIYVNGSQVTLNAWNGSYPAAPSSVNYDLTRWGSLSYTHRIGYNGATGKYWDGYMSEFVYLDGQSLAPTSFAETDSNGVWRPLDISAQSLTFGNQGFYLPFTSSTKIGSDYSTGSAISSTRTRVTEWNGDTGDFSAVDYDNGTIAIGGNQGGIRTNDSFTGDFAFQFKWNHGANPAYVGVYEIDEDATFSSTAADGGLGSMTDSFYLYIGAGSAVNALKGSSTEASTIFTVTTAEYIKMQREGSTFKVFEDGVLRHTFTGTSSNEVRIVIAQSSSSMNWDFFEWTSGSSTIAASPSSSGHAPSQSSDSPTKNYAVITPLHKHASSNSLSEGNRVLSSASNGWFGAVGSVAIRYGEKRYFEAKCLTNTRIYFGLSRVLNHNGQDIQDSAVVEGSANFDYMWRTTSADQIYYQGSNQSATVSAVSVNDIVSCTTETNGTVKFYKNGTLVHTFSTTLVDGDVYHPIFSVNGATSTEQVQANFGSGDVTQQESGYTLLEAADLHSNDPVGIEDGSAYFQATGYTGTGGANEIDQSGNSTFQPDLVWLKERQGNHGTLIDAVRGGNKGIYPSLSSQGEYTESNLSFDADGFSLTTTGAAAQVNANGNTNMGWQWLAGNGTSTPSGGSIASTVSVNQTAGFSIVSWTGSGANATIAHGLGSTPKWIIIKNRDSAQHVVVYSSEIPNGQYLLLSDTGASSGTDGAAHFNDSQPDATVFPVGTSTRTNGTSNAMIAWCWCEKPGFSRFGSFEGNGQSANGPFIELGFKPAFFMWKNIDSSTNGDWTMMDNSRDPLNMVEDNLRANSTMASDTGEADLDFLSNGVRHRGGTSERFNTDNQTYFYMAFAEHPFAGTSPGTAR